MDFDKLFIKEKREKRKKRRDDDLNSHVIFDQFNNSRESKKKFQQFSSIIDKYYKIYIFAANLQTQIKQSTLLLFKIILVVQYRILITICQIFWSSRLYFSCCCCYCLIMCLIRYDQSNIIIKNKFLLLIILFLVKLTTTTTKMY